jgi:hypothetical protein
VECCSPSRPCLSLSRRPGFETSEEEDNASEGERAREIGLLFTTKTRPGTSPLGGSRCPVRFLSPFCPHRQEMTVAAGVWQCPPNPAPAINSNQVSFGGVSFPLPTPPLSLFSCRPLHPTTFQALDADVTSAKLRCKRKSSIPSERHNQQLTFLSYNNRHTTGTPLLSPEGGQQFTKTQFIKL